jgi:uncharacterized phage protein (TIGR02218 family)
VLGFTSSSSDIVFQGVTYLAAAGHVPSSVITGSDMSVDNLEVVGILSAQTISDADLIAGVWDFADVLLFEINWADLTMGSRTIRTGKLGQVSTGRSSFTAELRGLMQNFQQTVGEVFGDTCSATFGDAKCKYGAASVTTTYTVASTADGRTFTASASHPSGYHDFGDLAFTSGRNVNKSAQVRAYTLAGTQGTFVTELTLPFQIVVGDQFTCVRGCDKSLMSCEGNFNNSVNFRGFFTVPGMDRMLTGT